MRRVKNPRGTNFPRSASKLEDHRLDGPRLLEHGREKENQSTCHRTESEYVLTCTCTTIAICTSLSISPTNPPLFNLPRRSFTPTPRFMFLTFQEVKLHNGTPAQRRVWDDLATIYSIIVCLEFVEKAYVRDTITQAQCPPPH
jgi:hypothetical protein